MTQIVGKVGGFESVSGRITATLSAPLIDRDTTPHTVHFPIDRQFPLTDGNVNISLPQTELAGISYTFKVSTIDSAEEFYFADGQQYFGPTIQHTDTNWYTGSFYLEGSSLRLSRVVVQVETPVYEFSAIVPNVEQCEYSDLLPTGFTTDRMPQGARQIASLLAFDDHYQTVLGNAILSYQGDWSEDAWYKPRQWVSYAGGSWYSKHPAPHQGNAPSPLSPYWALLAQKGEPGGTGGQDTAYDSTGWEGAMWAPTANVLRDKFELMASIAMLAAFAPTEDPTLTGAVIVPSLPPKSRDDRAASTAYVDDAIDSIGTLPIGARFLWHSTSAPARCVPADGRELSRTAFDDLFALWGTSYGTGNGSTTFNVPTMPDYPGAVWMIYAGVD